jgi:protein tyrosine phosphatase (PTP) superfamily phosphohydrolase (DUF442 family)
MAPDGGHPRPGLFQRIHDSLRWLCVRVRGNLHVVEPGVLYRAAAASPTGTCTICQRLGIRTVVEFRGQTPEETHAIDEATALEKIGVIHHHTPTHQVPTPDVVERFLEIMDDPANHPVLIHCSHGRGRTGVFAAIYRMEYQGWNNDDALTEARKKSGRLPGSKGFRDDARKGEFLLAYQPRNDRKEQSPAPPDTGPDSATEAT